MLLAPSYNRCLHHSLCRSGRTLLDSCIFVRLKSILNRLLYPGAFQMYLSRFRTWNKVLEILPIQLFTEIYESLAPLAFWISRPNFPRNFVVLSYSPTNALTFLVIITFAFSSVKFIKSSICSYIFSISTARLLNVDKHTRMTLMSVSYAWILTISIHQGDMYLLYCSSISREQFKPLRFYHSCNFHVFGNIINFYFPACFTNTEYINISTFHLFFNFIYSSKFQCSSNVPCFNTERWARILLDEDRRGLFSLPDLGFQISWSVDEIILWLWPPIFGNIGKEYPIGPLIQWNSSSLLRPQAIDHPMWFVHLFKHSLPWEQEIGPTLRCSSILKAVDIVDVSPYSGRLSEFLLVVFYDRGENLQPYSYPRLHKLLGGKFKWAKIIINLPSIVYILQFIYL